jgi:conjugative transposon TraK protein
MEFKALTNINSAFNFIRVVAFASIGATVVICCFCFVYFGILIQREREKVYVLDNGKSLILALQQDMSTNRPAELKDNIRMFHEYFFTIIPDVEGLNKNVKRAFELSDKSTYIYYQSLKEAGYYNQALSNDIYQRIEIDSIIYNMDVYPYQATTYARTFIRRKSNITLRTLVTSCVMSNITRSDNNPHGFLIENFVVIENKHIETTKRNY